jgi:hypothetical protein
VGSREVSELQVQERPPSTLRNTLTTVDGGPPGGAGAGGPGAPTINAKKRIDGEPPGGAVAGGLEVGDVDSAPLGVLAAGPAAATTKVEDVDGGGPGGLLPVGPTAAAAPEPTSTGRCGPKL